MLLNLRHHELEVVKAFFSRGIAWAKAESAAESVRLAMIEQPDSETVEDVICSPQGAHQLEQIVLRSVVNELNCLCEFALQNAWIQLASNQLTNNQRTRPDGQVFMCGAADGKLASYQPMLPDGSLVFAADRGTVEQALRNEKELGDRATDVRDCPVWQKIGQIKELSEGFKHRQRLQPFPIEFQSSRNQRRSKRRVDPDNEYWLAEYELVAADVAIYIDAVEYLFSWLDSRTSFNSISRNLGV